MILYGGHINIIEFDALQQPFESSHSFSIAANVSIKVSALLSSWDIYNDMYISAFILEE